MLTPEQIAAAIVENAKKRSRFDAMIGMDPEYLRTAIAHAILLERDANLLKRGRCTCGGVDSHSPTCGLVHALNQIR